MTSGVLAEWVSLPAKQTSPGLPKASTEVVPIFALDCHEVYFGHVFVPCTQATSYLPVVLGTIGYLRAYVVTGCDENAHALLTDQVRCQISWDAQVT